jgi:hypothetical protein
MTINIFIEFIVNYVLPIVALVMSFLFWMSGKKNAEKSELLLEELRKYASSWQNEIMNSSIEMMNCRPELAGHKAYMAKIETANKLVEIIQTFLEEIVKNPKTGDEGKAQYDQLKLLLDRHYHYYLTIVEGKQWPDEKEMLQEVIKKFQEDIEKQIISQGNQSVSQSAPQPSETK